MAEFIYTMVRARKAVGDKVILDDVTMSFFPGAKIGMVGPNETFFQETPPPAAQAAPPVDEQRTAQAGEQ